MFWYKCLLCSLLHKLLNSILSVSFLLMFNVHQNCFYLILIFNCINKYVESDFLIQKEQGSVNWYQHNFRLAFKGKLNCCNILFRELFVMGILVNSSTHALVSFFLWVRVVDILDHLLMVDSRSSSLQKVQNELLVVYGTQLLEKEHSGCRVLLRDDKVLFWVALFRFLAKLSKTALNKAIWG